MRRMITASICLPPPGPRDVHLWCLFPEDVQDPGLLQAYSKLLCPSEAQHVAEATTAELRKERLLARALVRTTLARYSGGLVQPASLRFHKNKHGKPEVSWPSILGPVTEVNQLPRLRFNLSHTRSLIACGVTTNRQIGVDVEEISRGMRGSIIALARRRFAPEEADWLQDARDTEEQRRRFVQLWTLKEAYVKALGRGIAACPLRNFSIRLQASPAIRAALEVATGLSAHKEAMEIILVGMQGTGTEVEPLLHSDSWSFMLLQPTPAHFTTLCVERLEESAIGGALEDIARIDQLQAWRTVPLLWDQKLPHDALALGLTPPKEFKGGSSFVAVDAQ